MLALLQALLCHSWVACQARHRRCTLPSLETSSSQTGNSKHTCCTCLPDKDGPQQQQSGDVQHQLHDSIQNHQQATNQQTSSQQAHQLQQHACLLDNDRTQTCDGSQQQHCQQHQQQQSCLQHDHQRQPVYPEQEDQAYMPRALQPDIAQQLAAVLPSCMCQLERHDVHIKIVVCCIILQALPFVAWVKQPRHSRQFAAWSDAMPYAVMAMHGAVLAILVSRNSRCQICLYDLLIACFHGPHCDAKSAMLMNCECIDHYMLNTDMLKVILPCSVARHTP